MNDGKGLAERLLGLDGFRVLEVTETPHEVVITVETTVEFVGRATLWDPGYGPRTEGGGGP